jgi:AcrR family transcriptional regulator
MALTIPSNTKASILSAAKHALVSAGYARLSTRKVAETAGVPLSQIHYHFGSKHNLVLELLELENQRLLARQKDMYGRDMPLWKQWEQACDYLEDDLASGYVRILQEMTAAGWSDSEIATAVRRMLRGWFDLLADTAARAAERAGGLGPFTPPEAAVLAGMPFLGVEAMLLLGFEESELPSRSALRKVGELLRSLEDGR